VVGMKKYDLKERTPLLNNMEPVILDCRLKLFGEE
jgi:hypothetical protein